MSIINIPLTLSSAAPTSMIPEVSALYATGDIDETRRRVDQTVQLSMFISIPCAVGLAVLAQPIVLLLFGGTNGVAGKLLMLGSFTILLNGMSNISNGVLQGIGKPKIPMITAAVALVVDVIVVVALLMFTDLGIYALLVAMIVYAIVVCVMNDFFMKKYLEYKNPWKAAYVSPLIASAVMGVVAAGVYYGFHAILPSNIICLGVSIILAAAAYFLVYILVDKTASERLSRMLAGHILFESHRESEDKGKQVFQMNKIRKIQDICWVFQQISFFVIKFDTQINLGNEYATNCETWSLSFVKLCRIMLRNSILEKYF